MTKIRGAYILVKYKNRYIFQNRDNNPGISSPGLLSTFGGAREAKDKNLLENAKRELHEETDLPVDKLDFVKLGLVGSDKNPTWHGEAYLVEVSDDHFKVFEGRGFKEFTDKELKSEDMKKFAKSAQEIIQRYILQT